MIGALFIAIDKAVFQRPSNLVPGLPASVDAWFARALAREVEDRFGSAREFAQAFQDAIRGAAPETSASAGAPLPAMPAHVASRTATLAGAAVTTPSPKRSMGLAVVGGLAAVAVLAAAGFGVGLTWSPATPTASADGDRVAAAPDSTLPASAERLAPEPPLPAPSASTAPVAPSSGEASVEPPSVAPPAGGGARRESGTKASNPAVAETSAPTTTATAPHPAPPAATSGNRDYGF